MRKVGIEEVYRVGSVLAPLKKIWEPHERVLDAYIEVLHASYVLGPFYEAWGAYLGTAKEPARKLQESLLKEIEIYRNSRKSEGGQGEIGKRTLGDDTFWLMRLKGLVEQFETVFSEESPRINTFVADQVAVFQMQLLIEDASVNIDENLRSELSEGAIRDYRDAGRALAFDLFTACGFHVLRCLESVILDYHNLLTGESPPEGQKNTGAILVRLKGKSAPARITSLLGHLKDQDRNPLFHAERTALDRTEALTLFPLATGAIHEFAAALKALRASPSAQP